MKIQPYYTGVYHECSCHRETPPEHYGCRPTPPPGFYFCLYVTDCESKLPLAGAVLQLHDNMGWPVQTALTDGRGVACFCLAQQHSYRLIEQRPPEGYQPDLTPHSLVVDVYGNVQIDGHPAKTYNICNQPLIPALYAVTYDANGGSGGRVVGDLPAGTIHRVLTEAEAGVAFSGNTFTGWNTAPDGSGVSYLPGQNLTVTGDITLYAQWQLLPGLLFSVTYDANGGSGGMTIEDLPAGTTYTVLTDVEAGIYNPGETFLSWNTAPDGGGVSYLPDDELVVLQDIILYAQWL